MNTQSKKHKFSEYLSLGMLYLYHFGDDIKKKGKTVGYDGVVYTEMSTLKEAVKLQLTEVFNNNELENDITLKEAIHKVEKMNV